MDHYIDIDGRQVMAGSPDLQTCAVLELAKILDSRQGFSNPLLKLSSLSFNPTDPRDAFVQRAKEALALVARAHKLLADSSIYK